MHFLPWTPEARKWNHWKWAVLSVPCVYASGRIFSVNVWASSEPQATSDTSMLPLSKAALMLGGRGSGADSARAATAIRSVGALATRSVGDLNKDRPPSSSIDGARVAPAHCSGHKSVL